MADKNDGDEKLDLLDKARLMRKAHPGETDVEFNYREKLIAGSRKTHLGKGEGKPELSAAEKLRAAHASQRPHKETSLEISVSEKAYTEKMVASTKKHYGL